VGELNSPFAVDHSWHCPRRDAASGDLQPAAAELPLEYLGVPITYPSINDFLNLLVHLRTVSELLEYLNARRALLVAALHTVGDEKPLFELYLMNGGNLNGCTGLADAKRAVLSVTRSPATQNTATTTG
jgi:hypothetical protein